MRDDAKWVLETDRLDLVNIWFKAREAEISELLDQAEKVAYGGLDGFTTRTSPADIVLQLETCWRDAAYLEELTKRQFNIRSATWPEDSESDEARGLRIAVQKLLETIAADVKRIADLVYEIRETVRAAAIA